MVDSALGMPDISYCPTLTSRDRWGEEAGARIPVKKKGGSNFFISGGGGGTSYLKEELGEDEFLSHFLDGR